jgi:uncharacterized lipoprotein YddW (UPF0748 family)
MGKLLHASPRQFPHGLFFAAFALLLLPTAIWATPAPPKPDYSLLDALNPTDDAAAKTLWQPMKDTPSAVLEGSAVRMTCPFGDTTAERTGWDANVRLNLSTKRGLCFRFYCENPEPVSYFACYLKSGGGWYMHEFAAEEPGRWTTIRFDRLSAKTEGAPAGWGNIEAVRISAWRGGSANTAFCVAQFGAYGGGGNVLLLRGDTAAQQANGDKRAILDSAESMAQMLDDAGVAFTPLSDAQLTATALKGMRLVILPFNPSLPSGAAGVLTKFVQQGGKLFSCYQIPIALQNAAGLKPGKLIAQPRAGYFAAIHRTGKAFPQLPETVAQRSWNMLEMFPVEGRGSVAAEWLTDQGEKTNEPALIVTDTTVHLTHVLLRDNPADKRRLLLAILAYCAPDTAKEALQAQLEQAGALGAYPSYTALREALAKHAKKALAKADSAYIKAQKALEKGQLDKANAAITELRNHLLDALAEAQSSKTGEFRGFWCHDGCGVNGLTWDEAVKNLADNGFTAIFPNLCWGGVAYYPSDVLPPAKEVEERGDQLAQCLEACRKHHVECHVWKVCWNMGARTSSDFRARMKQEGRTQVRADGKALDDWLCPSNPANQKLEVQALAEIAKKYKIDGVHLDYIRYPEQRACFCNGCKTRFEKFAGKKIKHWPGDVDRDPALHERWLAFRREQITSTVAAIGEAVRKARPGIKVSAAVYPNWERDRDQLGQDWKLWCEKGYLDFACPMDYTTGAAQLEGMIKRQQGWHAKAGLYPGIGLSTWEDGNLFPRLVEQIKALRRQNTNGFMIFNYGPNEARDIVPRCGLGLTRKSNAAMPEPKAKKR